MIFFFFFYFQTVFCSTNPFSRLWEKLMLDKNERFREILPDTLFRDRSNVSTIGGMLPCRHNPLKILFLINT